ncbi:hypothetical protein HOP51_16010 [Halomonas sp. MCCC 1A11036]|uniref:GntP family permease n=1 Tax=Billgrantia zhangzhouensis TaxID=2733481 RepID=A0ABS9AIM9_9GAMM|nr:hypothetical protein [Halomonas zhangzhouensis]
MDIDPILLFLSAATGASIACHVNDSFFWVYNNTLGFNMNTSLKTLTVANVISALGALFGLFLIEIFFF